MDIRGTLGTNTLRGTSEPDQIQGFSGDDTLHGEGGNDRIDGGDGLDALFGGDGNDLIYGGPGPDRIAGDTGDADIASWFSLAAAGPGGVGIDASLVPTGVNPDSGLPASVVVEPGGTVDILTGIEQLRGSSYADQLGGNDLANTLVGYAGRDSLTGRGGADRLEGGEGDDRLQGGTGNDLLFGGAGRDRFVFARGDGSDRVYDIAPGDTLEIRGFGEGLDHDAVDALARQVGANTVVRLDAATTLTLVGFDAGNLGDLGLTIA